ncbi:MAG: PAS domain S-box protein [Candidatus Limnocylindrales bacterium]
MAQPPQEADTARLPPTAIRIVIVEDRPSDAELMILGLQEEGFAPDWQRVENDLALVIALEGNPDLILSDWSLPHFSGLEALEIVRERDPHVPFIIVSGSVGEEAAIDALHRGADDYVLKDRLARLGPAVRRALEAERLRAERRRAAAQLAFQASVLANVRDAVIVSDLAGRITYWNDGATATFGYAAAEMVGRPMGELSPTHAPALEAALKASATDPGSTGTWPMRHRDGRQLWIEARTASMTDPAGAPIGVIGVARDVTEHRRLELEAERLATAIEQAREAVMITDTEARILYVNPAFERITGYTRTEVIGENPRILQSGVHPAAFYQAMWSALAMGQSWVAEFTNRRKDGSLFQEQAHISPIRDADGVLTSYVAVKHDVTRERELEEAARQVARERALIADTLARLPTGSSAEATAEGICRQVVGLSGLVAVAVVQFDHEGRAVPLAFVTADGAAQPQRRLSVARSLHLRSRALEGPWVEAWLPGDSYEPYLQLHAELGTSALAEVPIRHAGALVGMLAAFSAATDGVARLTNTLPALAELADLTGVVLGPTLAERMSSGRLNKRIQTIIDQGAFHPVFQPVVDLETSQIVGFEALTRFDSGDQPDLLFADAWSVGMGPDLEVATLRAAVALAARLPSGPWLSLNVSPRLFAVRTDLAVVLAPVEQPLVIEVTEHETVPDYAVLRAAVRALGPRVRLAVDDAGAGAANFAHIVGLRPDFVKLDMGLVRGISRDVGRQALVVGMRHFAQSAGCHLIAEGIETRAEADTLTSLGAEFGQGYLYGRPAPVDHWVSGAAGPVVTPGADPG